MGVVNSVQMKCPMCGHSGQLDFWVTLQMWCCRQCQHEVRNATGYEDGYDPNHPTNRKLHNQNA